MSNKKILPVSYPMITSWQWHATLFSIIGDDERARNGYTAIISSLDVTT